MGRRPGRCRFHLKSKFDLSIQPGGSGAGQGRHPGEDGPEAIRGFVKNGGGFVGICAGSCLASADYEWSLNILDEQVIDRKHWNRGQGTVEIAITDSRRRLLGTETPNVSILYAEGPVLASGNRPEIEDNETVVIFETEITENGAPEGVMKGKLPARRTRLETDESSALVPIPSLAFRTCGRLTPAMLDKTKRENAPLCSRSYVTPARCV
jgi:hypothetical protein